MYILPHVLLRPSVRFWVFHENGIFNYFRIDYQGAVKAVVAMQRLKQCGSVAMQHGLRPKSKLSDRLDNISPHKSAYNLQEQRNAHSRIDHCRPRSGHPTQEPSV